MSYSKNLFSTPLILILFCFYALLSAGQIQGQDHTSDKPLSYNVFPILMYDSDIGFGFGGKGIIKNLYQSNESFDLILFASSKGQQWYVFTFSIPDFEIRQGTLYDLSIDLKLEYDKVLKSNFFGFGNASPANDLQFPREISKAELTFGHAFSRQIIGTLQASYLHSCVFGYDRDHSPMSPQIPGAGESQTFYMSTRLRWDNRDSQIHPRHGWHIGGSIDHGLKWRHADFDFTRYRLEINKYQQLFSSAHILAGRFWAQHINGTAPYFNQSIIGGTGTARGFTADRFIDHDMLLASLEYRFAIYKRTGGVAFMDAGRVFTDVNQWTFNDWKSNWGWGLRYYLTHFVVRFDMGISKENTRIFFNFGHVF